MGMDMNQKRVEGYLFCCCENWILDRDLEEDYQNPLQSEGNELQVSFSAPVSSMKHSIILACSFLSFLVRRSPFTAPHHSFLALASFLPAAHSGSGVVFAGVIAVGARTGRHRRPWHLGSSHLPTSLFSPSALPSFSSQSFSSLSLQPLSLSLHFSRSFLVALPKTQPSLDPPTRSFLLFVLLHLSSFPQPSLFSLYPAAIGRSYLLSIPLPCFYFPLLLFLKPSRPLSPTSRNFPSLNPPSFLSLWFFFSQPSSNSTLRLLFFFPFIGGTKTQIPQPFLLILQPKDSPSPSLQAAKIRSLHAADPFFFF